LEQLDRLGASVLLPDDDRFPPLLRDIPEPPALLYAWGDVGLLARPAAGVVGSRNHTAYGGAAAQFLAAGVARAGVVVVSGMARGIDATAHAAALDSGGASVGVLGNGFGVVYPAANPALCPGDILEELGLPGTADPGPMARGQTPEGTSESAGAPPRGQPPDLTELQRSLWDALASEPKHVDALVAAAHAETSAVLTALTELEMRGLVKQEPGMRFGIT